MANRRMFSKTVVASSRFLRMPATSRLLYYDLGMAADDDGYCEWYPVMQMTGAKEQDFQVLVSNELIYLFDNEVLVIKDWKENNFIRSDRYQPSKYVGKYEDMLGLSSGIPKVDPGKVRLGKDNTSVAIAPRVVEVADHEEEKKTSAGNKYTKKYQELCDWMESLTGVKFVDRSGQYKALKTAREADVDMERLKERAEELWHGGKYEKDGMDWFTVVYSFNKRA